MGPVTNNSSGNGASWSKASAFRKTTRPTLHLSGGLDLRVLNEVRRRDLTDDDASKMQLEYADYCERPAIRIPYFDLDGNRYDFCRFRFLDKGTPKYMQLPNTEPQIYVPPALGWKEVVKNINVPLYVTEGEFKSYVAAKHGLLCVGLGGVWSFASKKLGQQILRGFADLDLKDCTVVIVFDSDVRQKPNVLAALHAFAWELSGLGAKVETVFLPDAADGTKQGLDDFIVAEGSVTSFTRLPRHTFEVLEKVWKLNSDWAYVHDPSGYLHVPTGNVVKKQYFLDRYENQRGPSVNRKGEPILIALGSAFVKWPYRREVTGIRFEPGKEQILEDGAFNLWKGWGVQPKQGSVGLWHQLLDHIFGSDREARRWFEQWCAYPIAHPGTKHTTAVVLIGATGVGKTFLGQVVGSVYHEDHFYMIGQKELHSEFNEWARNRQFVLADEVSSTDTRSTPII